MILTETEMIIGKLNPGLVDRALAQLRQDKLPRELLVDIQHVPLNCITEVRENIYSLTVYYTQENKPASADIIINYNKATTRAMLRALAYRLSKLPEGSAVRLTKGLNWLTSLFIYVIVVLVLSIFLGLLDIAWALIGHSTFIYQ